MKIDETQLRFSGSNLRSETENEFSAKPTARLPRSHKDLQVSATQAFRVRKKGLKKSLHQVRFLLSKVLYRVSWLADGEEVVLIDRLFQVQSCREYFWLKKNAKLIRGLTELTYFYLKNRRKKSVLGVELIFGLPSNRKFLLDPWQYFGLESSSDAKEDLQFFNPSEKTKSPPRRVVGVGYRDHGTYRDCSQFGTPSWQEVATSHLFQETPDSVDLRLARFRLILAITGWDFPFREEFASLSEASYWPNNLRN